MTFTQSMRVAGAGLLACLLATTASAHTDDEADGYTYGQIPLTVTVCGMGGTAISLGASAEFKAGVDGRAGGGWHEAIFADAQARLTPGVGFQGAITTSAELQSRNCLDLINTLAGILPEDSDYLDNYENLDDAEVFMLRSLVSDERGEIINSSDLALGLIQNATNLSASVGTSRGMLANVGVVTETMTEAITGANPLDLQNTVHAMSRIAENSKGMLHPRLVRAMEDPERVINNHLQKLDVIRSSCNDLRNGEIEHLQPELLEVLENTCVTALDTQLALESFLVNVYGAIEVGGETVGKVANVVASGETMEAFTDTVDNSVTQVSSSAGVLVDSVEGLKETVSQSEQFLKTAIGSGHAIVSGSMASLSETTEELSGVLSDSAGQSSGNLGVLKDEVQRTADLIEGLSLTSVLELPGKLARTAEAAVAEVADQICEKKVGFVKIKDVPGVNSVLGC